MATIAPPDPTYQGPGSPNAWTAEYKPCRIHWLLGATGIDHVDAVLDLQPFPADYRPAKTVARGGTGQNIRVGWASATWNFEKLTAGQMGQLLTARDNAYLLNGGFVYIVTMTDTLAYFLDDASSYQWYRPTYAKFRAAIADPTYEAIENYNYTNVKVEFNHLSLV